MLGRGFSPFHAPSGLLTAAIEKLRLFRYFFSSARKRGLVRTVRISAYELYYSRVFGGETGRVIPIAKLGLAQESARHAQPYFPSSFLFLHEIFSSAQINCKEATFVDYGCGMGRVLLFASTLPFRKIVGVEISEPLCKIARANMHSYYQRTTQQLPEWSIVNADVREFDTPKDATVLYFYNPFDAAILDVALDQIQKSIRNHPRRCVLIYANPVHRDVFELRGIKRLFCNADDYSIYELQ
jgi:SAM-dependent methyltransferase